jgi:hypothetical protein
MGEKSSEKSSIPEAINIDELSRAVGGKFESVSEAPDAYIKKYQAKIAGYLAVGLWLAFIATVIWHGAMIQTIALKYIDLSSTSPITSASPSTSASPVASTPPSATGGQGNGNTRWEDFYRAASLVGDTAKTLYAVLSPLATAVTGFYFTSSVASSKEEK